MARETLCLDPGLIDVRLTGRHSSSADRARIRAGEQARHAAALGEARDAGYRQARLEADHAYAGQLMAQRQEVAELADGILRRLTEQQANLARQARGCVPALVMNIVRRLLGGAAPDGERAVAIIEQALAEAPTDLAQSLEVCLAPDDFAKLESICGRELHARHPNLTLRADPTLATNDCLVRGEFGLIDARMDTKLKAVESLLAAS